MLSLVLCLCLFACGDLDSSGTPSGDGPGITPGDTSGGGDETGGNDENGNGDETGGNDETDTVESMAHKMDKLVQDFWNSDTMYDETVLMVAPTDSNGNVTGAPRGKLMFAPTEVLSVTQYNAPSTNQFTSDDYTIEDGYMVAKGEIVDGAGGKKVFSGNLPYVNDKAITGEEPFPGVPQNTQIPSTDQGLYLPFCENGAIVKYQLYVCYKHEKATTDALPAFELGKLKNLQALLTKKNDIELFIYGDSISTGANCSGHLQLDPNTQPWFKLVQKNLGAAYDCKVNLKNYSVGGWTSSQGVSGGTGTITQSGLKALFENPKKLQGYVPDLAVLGFGMNDATLNVGIDTYKSNMKKMIDVLRNENPKCDIILLGTWLANPKAKNQCKNQTEYTASLYDVAKDYSNVIVVDVGKVHKAILDSGKSYTETSSNNVNHPNDFTTRMYAMSILKALVK